MTPDRRYPRSPITATSPSRHTQLGPAEVRLLDDWGRALRATFPGAFVCHVGSSMVRPDWRDIDVRIMLRNDDFATLATVIKPRRLNLMLTLWGRQVTGLPIDCQIQSAATANDRYPTDKHPRNMLGMRDSEGEEGA